MNLRLFACALVLSLAVRPVSAAPYPDVKSPDGSLVFHFPGGEEIPQTSFERQSCSILRGGQIIWSYVYCGKESAFSWAPDSKRILFAQYTGDGDVLMFVVDIDPGTSCTRLNQISLFDLESQMLQKFPRKPKGGWAPRMWINAIRWTAADECEFRLFDRGEGYDLEALVKVKFGSQPADPPKSSLAEIKDHFKER